MPAKVVEIHPEAAEETEAAIAWYLERSLSTAQTFAVAVRAALRTVAQTPKRWALFEAGARRYLLRDFPYAVIYRETGIIVQVLAIAHCDAVPGIGALELSEDIL